VGFTAGSCGAPGDASAKLLTPADERHGNSILKNGQHVFALAKLKDFRGKSCKKLWKDG
jgi:hypothetical protein